MAKSKICIIFGGSSGDHSASLATAYSVLTALADDDEFETIPVGITRSGHWLYYPGDYKNIKDGSWENDADCCPCILSPDPLYKGLIKILTDGSTSIQRIDAVFPLLHGKFGEDGRIQGLCKLSGIPTIGNDVSSSDCCLDKVLTYMLLEKAGLSTPEYMTLDKSILENLDDSIAEIEKKLGYPTYISPSTCSTSIGAYRATDRATMEEAIKTAFSHNPVIVAEKQTNGRNIFCAVIKGFPAENTVIGELITTGSKIDEVSEYICDSFDMKIPATFDGVTQSRIKDTAAKAFRTLSCRGYARVDMTYTDNGQIVVRRIRSIPGLSDENLFSRLVTKGGKTSYADMLRFLINSAINAR